MLDHGRSGSGLLTAIISARNSTEKLESRNEGSKSAMSRLSTGYSHLLGARRIWKATAHDSDLTLPPERLDALIVRPRCVRITCLLLCADSAIGNNDRREIELNTPSSPRQSTVIETRPSPIRRFYVRIAIDFSAADNPYRWLNTLQRNDYPINS